MGGFRYESSIIKHVHNNLTWGHNHISLSSQCLYPLSFKLKGSSLVYEAFCMSFIGQTCKGLGKNGFSSVPFSLSVVSDSSQPHESQQTRPPCPSPTPEFTQTHIYRVTDAIQPSHPLSSPSPPAPNPSSIRVFSSESTLRMRWPKYCSFSFSIIPSKEIPGLISFRMDWLDLPAVQGTLKSLLQHHSLKTSILRCSAVFTDQLSHPYMTRGKTIALTRQTFVGKLMSLLFNQSLNNILLLWRLWH